MISEVFECIEDINKGLDNSLNVKSTSNDGGGCFTLEVCCPKWAYIIPCKTIFNDGNGFQVVNITKDETTGIYYIKIKGELDTSTIDASLPFTIKEVLFKHGTPLLVNEELDQIFDAWDKFPLFYVHEILRIKKYSKHSDTIYKWKAKVRGFLLSEADYSEWTTDCHYKNVIDPLSVYADAFVDSVNEKCEEFAEIKECEIIPHANFGHYKDSGHYANIFSTDTSGVEIVFDLMKVRKENCKNC